MSSSSWSSIASASRSARGGARGIFVAALVWMAGADVASANCNLIPAAAKEFRSTDGTVDRTLVAPGNRVAVRVDLACDPTAPGFDPVAANNRAFVRFVPPASSGNPALETEFEIPAADLTPANCPVGGTRCDTLLLSFPDAATLDAALAPDGDGLGLTGPVRIRVENLAANVLAEVGPLYDPTLACGEQQPESVFGHLTAVPTPNSFGDLVAATDTTIEATLDGNGNLLIPVDYSAVLPNGPGSAVFRILQASADLDAFSGAPGAPIAIPAARYLRSFNLAGRPIPPVLETTGDGRQVFGTVDAQLSVVRIARIDPDAPGPPLYDLSDRLFSDRGPIVIANVNANARESAPLATLSADAAGITFARSEAAEGVDLNGDGDLFDRVPQVIDVQSGVGTGTGLSVTEVTLPGFARPVLQSGDGHIAFGASEGRNDYADQNADGDVMDSLLRAFDLFGNSLPTSSETIDPLPLVNGKPLAISNGLVFFRSAEADGATRTTTGLTPTVIAPFQQRGYSLSPSVSGDGRFVVFSSSGGRTFTAVAPPDALSHIYLYDRATGQYELIDRTPGGSGGDAAAEVPSISRDGRYVAYHSEAGNLPGADADAGASDVFLYDRQTLDSVCVSCGLGGIVAINPDLSADGTFIAYSANDAILIWERATQATTYLLAEVPSPSADSEFFIEGVTPSISGDGRYVTERFTLRTIPALGGIVLTDQVMRFDRVQGAVDFIAPGDLPQISADGQKIAFQSDTDLVTDDVNLATDAYVFDSALGLERISVNTDGQGGAGGVSIRSSSISDDGRFVAFIDDSGTEVPGSPGNRQVFRYDRATNVVEGVSVSDAGAFSDAMNNAVAISGDGQTVAFGNASSNLAPDSYTDVENIFVRSAAGTSSNAADADVTDTVLQVYDLASVSYKAGARVPASFVSVAGPFAGILSDEAADGGIDRNFDGDATDRVARIVNGMTGAVAETGLAASAIAISEAVACIAVNEATQGVGPLNGDGDLDDEVLFVRNLSTDQQTNTGITVNVTDLSATGTHCVFTTPELLAAGSPDLNFDTDLFDDVLGAYDISTAMEASFPYATADLVAKGDLVAFRVCEVEQDAQDLNFDGETLLSSLECVMHVLTLSTGQVENTQRAATACNLPGCDPFFEPFRVGTTTVSFLIQEEYQSGNQVPAGTPLAVDCKGTELPGGCDLSGDGDNNDSMISVYNVRSGLSQLVPISDGPSIVGQEVPPFPTEIGDSGVLYVQLLETQVGEDVNGDGVITAVPVLVLVGDADGDGSLDDSTNRDDTCVEVANPDQLDADGDQLGDDACDPAPASALPGDGVCDVDRNGQIDRDDANLIFGDRGAAARASDPRDPDGDGAITVLDVSECRAECTYQNCRTTPLPNPACGFGAELAVVMGALLAARRRRLAR